MATQIEICNLALLRLGVTERVTDIESPTTHEETQCDLLYEIVRGRVLEDFDWPFATAYATLANGTESTTSDNWDWDWDWRYDYPANCARIRRFVSSLGKREPNPAPFVIGAVSAASASKYVYTNVHEDYAFVEYTLIHPYQYTAVYPSQFVSAFAWLLASELGLALRAESRIMQNALQMYYNDLSIARREAANEQQESLPPDSEFVRARA